MMGSDMKIQTTPPKGPPPPRKPLPRPEQDELVYRWLEGQKEQVRVGDSLVVDLHDGRRFRVNGSKPGIAAAPLGNLQQFFTAGIQEVQAAIGAGPNLAIMGASQAVKPLVLMGVPDAVSSQVEQWYLPGVQGVSVALSLVNFIKRYQEQQNRKEIGLKPTVTERITLAANGLHIATSAVGLAGVAAGALSPALQHYALPALGIAVAGNVLCFAANYLEYFQERGDAILPLEGPEKKKP